MNIIVKNDVEAFSRIDAIGMILKTLSDITDLRYSIVARVTDDSWTACSIYDNMEFGLAPGDELELQSTYCNTIREQNAPLLVRHASQEAEFKDHPALATYGVESYIGVPLFRQNGEYFGVLCSLDINPTDISEKHLQTFDLMAKLIAHELEAEEQRSELEESLSLAHQTSESRARFMSILGHDLRNPLNSIVMAATLLQMQGINPEKGLQLAGSIVKISRRMNVLIEDLLDAAQSTQGNDILLIKEPADLREIYGPIVDEYRLAQPDKQIDFSAPEACPGQWDKGRVGQILSNLLSNAISYGNADYPIDIDLLNGGNNIVLRINNRGDLMSDEVKKNLFTAFWRGAKKVEAGANSSGLGLGLYIVSQIVKAHGGSIDVESTSADGTTFTVTLPLISQG